MSGMMTEGCGEGGKRSRGEEKNYTSCSTRVTVDIKINSNVLSRNHL
jgi:hypothetical protein